MLTKAQAQKEKEIIVDMTSRFSELTEAGKAELIKLKCRNELLTFIVIMSRKLGGDKFTPYDVHRIITEFVQYAADGNPDYDHLTISLPPRAGKSTIISQYLPAWQLGRNPKARFIMGSHTLNLTDRNASMILKIMSNPEYRRIFPKTKLVQKGLKLNKFFTTEDGGILSATPKIKISGFDAGTLNSGDFPGLILIDDLLASGESVAELNTAWNWLKIQLVTRTLPNIAFLSIGTRYSTQDVTGRLIEASPELWKTLNVPALCVDPDNDPLKRPEINLSFWEEKYPAKNLLMKKGIMGVDEFNTVYQGFPKGSRGNLLLEDDIIRIPEMINGSVFFSIDTNFKGKEMGDFNAVCVWSKPHDMDMIQLIDVYQSKSDFSSLLGMMGRLIKFYKPGQITVEARANGDALTTMLEQQFPGITIYPYTPLKDKVSRFSLASPLVKAGKVVFYNGISELDSHIKQLLQFPFGLHDDFPDAFALGIIFWSQVINSGEFSGTDLGYGVFLEERENPLDTSIIDIGIDKKYLSYKSALEYF